MATVVNGSARSCGVLLALVLGILCVMLQGATHRIAQDAVAIGHDTMESPLLLLDRPMMETKKMESVVSWNSFCQHFLKTNEQCYVRPWVLKTSHKSHRSKFHSKELSAKRAQVEKTTRGNGKAHHRHTEKLESFTKKLQDLSMEKCKITADLAQRAADLQKLDATEYKPTVAETMEVEQPRPQNRTEDQKNFRMEKRAEANAAEQAPQELVHYQPSVHNKDSATRRI